MIVTERGFEIVLHHQKAIVALFLTTYLFLLHATDGDGW